jgi:hypothetical protein
MHYLTYKELGELISKMSDEQKNQTATIIDHIEGEAHPVEGASQIIEDGEMSDVLDVGHIVLSIRSKESQ